MIGKFPLEISSLYCLTTFMTLSPHYLVIFIILSLFINEETLFFPGYHRYGLRFGLFSFRSGYGRRFTGRAYWFGISFIVSEICLIWLTVALILFFTVMGVWATNRLEPFWGEDPSRVVVDEMVGVWIALLAAPSGNVWYALGAFALFRLFDIFKPLGIRRMESFPGGIGVMMDDILAGIYSFVVLIGVRWLIS